MRTNRRMVSLIDNAPRVPLESLPGELQDILAAGWLEGPGGSLLLSALYGAGWRDDWAHVDVALHEYEVNDVWVPTGSLPDERELFLAAMTGRARSFATAALSLARRLDEVNAVLAVISVGVDDDYLTSGTTVKFFTQRGNYPRFYDALDRFELEALAVLDINDVD